MSDSNDDISKANPSKAKGSHLKKSKFFIRQEPEKAENSEESQSSSSPDVSGSEEVEESDENVYQEDGFVVADEDVSDEDQIPFRPLMEEPKIKKPKSKKPRRLRKFDDDDLQLINDNLEEGDSGAVVKRKPKVEEHSDDLIEEASDDDNNRIHEESDLQTLAAIFGHKPIEEVTKEPEPQFEPAEKKERFSTEEFTKIMKIDMPERLQYRFKNRENPSPQELQAESEWLTLRLMNSEYMKKGFSFHQVFTKVFRFLEFYRVENCEVTYMAIYKKHLLVPELSEKELWELEKWDYDWAFVWFTKEEFRKCIYRAENDTVRKINGEIIEDNTKLIRVIEGTGEIVPRQVKELLHKGFTVDFYRDIADLQKWIDCFVFTFRYSLLNDSVFQSTYEKIPRFLRNSGMSPLELSENLKERSLVYKCLPSSDHPESLAFDFLGEPFKDVSKVLSVAVNVCKKDIASLPYIRQFVREEYKKYVKLHTFPTEAGRHALDLYHPQYRVKLIDGKPLASIDLEFWADVWKAEKNGWISAEFRVSSEDFKNDKILPLIQPLYLFDEPNENDLRWNDFKIEVLQQALLEMYKDFASELYNDLCAKTEERIIEKCKTRYREIVAAPALFCKEDSDKSRKVLVFVTDPNEEFFGRTVAVVMDSNGHVTEVNEYRTITCRKFDTLKVADKNIYAKEKNDITRIFTDHNPYAVIIAANCLHSLIIRRYLHDLIKDQTSNLTDHSEDLIKKIFMHGVEVPKLFASSQRAKGMLPDSDVLVKTAVSLGRVCLFPVAETLSLSSDPNENLTLLLNLDPMQKLPNPKRLEWQLENVACQIVCAEQVEINRIIIHTHLQAPLAYVAGLGQAKAYKLLEMIFKKFRGKLKMRAGLFAKECLGPKVFENAAGFIYIPRDEEMNEPLDSTRIHPQHYKHAVMIAMSALESKGTKEEEAISRLMREPKLIDTLDLQIYTETLEQRPEYENIKDVFAFITSELKAPSKNERGSKECLFKEPEGLDLLYLVSGETKETLAEEKLVNCTVIGYDEKNTCLVVKLESGLRGSIDSTKIVDDHSPSKEEMKGFIKGMSLTARVLKIECRPYDMFRIKLSVLNEDIKDHKKYLQKLDESFKKLEEDWNEKAGLEEDEYRQGQKYVPRVVNHVRFKNVNLKSACAILDDKDIGECLFRPSSRGQDHLTCTWKFYEGVFAHLDIVEEGKPAINMLGTRFRISDETYDSLQEIIDRYIMPCEKLTKDAISNPKFRDNSANIVQMLKQEKRASPSRIPYYFTITEQYPQFLLLHYIPKEKTVTEYIKVKPRGLFFHEAYHTSLNYLIGWFKRHQMERHYQQQLQKTKPPAMDTSSHMAIKGRQEKPRTPLHPSQSTPRAEEYEGLSAGGGTPDHYLTNDDRKDKRGKRTPRGGKSERFEKNDRFDKRDDRNCKICGNFGHLAKDCNEKEKKCYKCGLSTHLAKNCNERVMRDER